MKKAIINIIIILLLIVIGCGCAQEGNDVNKQYEHHLYSDDVFCQIYISATNEFDEEKNGVNTDYGIYVSINGRKIDEVTQNYKVDHLKMFATTLSKLTDKKTSDIYNFTEKLNYMTPITHFLPIRNKDNTQYPAEFYINLKYENNGEAIETYFKEEILVQPTKKDIKKIESLYKENGSTSTDEVNILDKKNDTYGVVKLNVVDAAEEEKYYTYIEIETNDERTNKFHIDMQSWIVTEDGQYLPHMGVYNYAGISKNFNKNMPIDKNIKPKYIIIKTIYFNVDKDEQYITFLKKEIIQ